MAYDERFGYLATSSSDKFITLWNSNNQIQRITDLHGHETNIIDINFMANSKSLLSISEDGVLKLWNTETFRCLQTVELEFVYPSKSYLGSKVIFERLISESENTIDMDSPDYEKSKVSAVLIASENTITIFSVKGCDVFSKKPLPLKNLEPKLPSPEITFKHYYRENPLSFRELEKIELKKPVLMEDEREDVMQFIKQGAVYLGLKLLTVDDKATSIYGSLL
ncbi:uncharacterized protein [Halyomorpha halys]|uniref:uncharacterized protein n=1 Tax=Halyomorpha halys TaxID=286706 RepID=UPI0006D52784